MISNDYVTTNPEMVVAAPIAKELREDVNELNDALTDIEDRLKYGIVGAWSTTELQANNVKVVPWPSYEFLIFAFGFYSNVYQTRTVPSVYFNTTSSSSRVVIVESGNQLEIYRNVAGDGIAVTGSNITANARLTVWGFNKK